MKAKLVLLLAMSGSPIVAHAAVRSEVKVWAASAAEFRLRLGDVLGELDVCSYGESKAGRPYLILNVDARELLKLRASGLETEVTWPDIRDKFRAVTGCEPDDGSFRDFGYFFNYWEMRDTLTRLASLHPGIAHIDTSMRSHQGRPLWCIKVSDNPGIEEGEPQVFFNGATHAREPLGTHLCIAFASLLCQEYGRDSLVTWLVDNREVFFVPVMNPDGYVYNSDSGGASSNWRKNRRVIQEPYVGVDLNRNYGYKWGYDNSGSSPNPGSETYRGPYRFSEPAVEAIHQFEAAHKFRCQFDFHTFGRYNLYPWAYAAETPPEPDLLREIADTLRSNNGYSRTGQWYHTLYPSNGTSVDWEVADTLDNGVPKFITYAFTCELGINDFWYGASNPPYVDSEVGLNIPNCFYFTRLGGAFLVPAGVVVNDSVTGNRTGRLDPGETADLWFTLTNRALHAVDTAKSVTAVVVSNDTLVQILTPGTSFPSLPRRSSANSRQSSVRVRCSPNAVPGTVVGLELSVTFTDDNVAITQPVRFQVTIGDSLVGIDEPGAGPELARHGRPGFGVRPNPASSGSQTWLILPPCSGPARLRIFSPDGRVVRSFEVRPSSTRSSDFGLRTSDFRLSGVYFARFETDGRSFDARFVLVDRGQ